MPQIGAAAFAIGGALASGAGAVATGVGAVLGGSALGGGLGGAVLGIFSRIALGSALNVAARALQPQQDPKGASGTRLRYDTGENVPASRILGRYFTAGDLVYHNSWGAPGDTPHEYYVWVYEIADFPAALSRVRINGEWATLDATATEAGQGVEGYEDGGKFRLFVKFLDGGQTAPDPYLVEKFGTDPDAPWMSDMIGRGIPCAIVTAGWRPEVNRRAPECGFEVVARHYDRRQDSTAGGSGAHRWADLSTWEPSDNLAVQLDNVLRGFRDPVTGKFLWGGQDIGNRELPASQWFAAMNEADVAVGLEGGGTEPQFRAGMEVMFDRQPVTIAEELLAGGHGSVAEVAGEWHIRLGAPGAAVYAFTDEDIIVTSEDTFSVCPSLDDAYNGVSARYPEPGEGWAAKDAPLRESAEYLEEDGGRRNIAALELAAVPFANQVQRVQAAALEDSRRFRRHDLVLPPEARKLAPLDVVSWTSARNGYSNKLFEIDAVEDLDTGCVAVSLREVDPDDYSWSSDLELPTSVTDTVRPGRQTDTVNFAFVATYAKDSSGNQRRPNVTMTYAAKSGVREVQYEGRLVADTDHQPIAGTAPAHEGGGQVPINNVLPVEIYQFRGRFRGRPWSNWYTVETLDVRLIEEDLAQIIRDKINQGIADAAAAAAEATAALAKANEVEADLAALSLENLEEIQERLDALAGIDTGTIEEIRGIQIASLRDGWHPNPAFATWTGGAPDNWNAVLGAYGVQSDQGYLGSAIDIDVPGGGPEVSLIARSNVAAEMPDADHQAAYVALGIRAVFRSGTFNGAYLQVQWRRASDAVWVNGDAFGLSNASGLLASDWGFRFDPNARQDKVAIFKRPAITSDAIRIRFVPHPDGATATSCRIDWLNLSEATEADIKAYLANQYADAAVQTLNVAITGPSGAIAASMNTVRAEFAASDALISEDVLAIATETSSLAGKVTALESVTGDRNYVKNPVFADGVRPAGQTPNYWAFWDASFSVAARGGGSNASQNAPTAYYGLIAAGSGLATAQAHGPVAIDAGDLIAIEGQFAAQGSGINVAVGLRVRWLDADQAVLDTATRFLTMSSTGWRSVSDAYPDPLVPVAGAKYYDLWVRRDSGQSLNDIPFTSIQSRKVDAVAYARAQEALQTATDAESAFASIDSDVSVSFASFSAFVSAAQTALTTADQAASSFAIRVGAGASEGLLSIVAWDDVDGTGSVFKFDGDHAIFPGTVSAQTAVIGDLGMNKVPDDDLQSANVWPENSGYEVRPATTRTDVSSGGEIFWTDQGGTGNAEITSNVAFTVRPGMRLSCSFEVVAAGGANMRATGAIRWEKSDGTYLSVSNIAWIETSGTSAVQTGSAVLVAPPEAYRARWRWRVDEDNTNGNVRFFAPRAIEQNDGAVLITPRGITAGLLAVEELIADSAQIGNLVVATSNIANNAITDTYSALTEATFKVENGVIDNWTTIQTLTVTKTRDTPTFFRAYLEARLEDPGSPRAIAIRIVRMNGAGDSVQSTVTTVAATITDSGYSTIQASGLDLGSWTTRQFRIQAFMDPSEDVLFQNVYLSALQEVVPKK